MRKQLGNLLYAIFVVYIAALSGWRLHSNHDSLSILLNLSSLACMVTLVYIFLRERGGK